MRFEYPALGEVAFAPQVNAEFLYRQASVILPGDSQSEAMREAFFEFAETLADINALPESGAPTPSPPQP
jgi:hypothetical protein